MKKLNLTLIFSLVLVVFGCKNPTKSYDEMEARELSSGISRNDLLLGLHLGMDGPAFFKRCKELNGQQLLTEGDGGLSVRYFIPAGKMKYPAQMTFYPAFQNDKIYVMPMIFTYTQWAPWNQEMTAIKLVEDVKKYAESEYGKGFIPVKDPKRGNYWVKVEGNRRITIGINTESTVKMVIADLRVVKEMEKQGKTVSW